MFRIRNTLPGTLALDLQEGAIHLMSGKSFDLEGVCSREWIENDPTLNRLITAMHLEVVCDSNIKIKKDPIHKAVIAKENVIDTKRRAVPRANVINIPEIVVPKITKTVVEVLTPEEDPVEAAMKETVEEEKQDRLITFEDTLTEDEIKDTKKVKGRRGRKPAKDNAPDFSEDT